MSGLQQPFLAIFNKRNPPRPAHALTIQDLVRLVGCGQAMFEHAHCLRPTPFLVAEGREPSGGRGDVERATLTARIDASVATTSTSAAAELMQGCGYERPRGAGGGGRTEQHREEEAAAPHYMNVLLSRRAYYFKAGSRDEPVRSRKDVPLGARRPVVQLAVRRAAVSVVRAGASAYVRVDFALKCMH